LIANLGSLNELVRILDNTLHFDDELVVTLVGIVLPQALRGDYHAYVISVGAGFHGSYRRREICDIQFTAQTIRHSRFHEIDDQIRALLPNINPRPGITQIDDDASLAILTTTKHHVIHRMPRSHEALFGETS